MKRFAALGPIAAHWLFPLLLPCVAACATSLGFVAVDALIHACVEPVPAVASLHQSRRM